MKVNGLPIPELLQQMLVDQTWQHPGDAVLKRLIPQLYSPIYDPVDFLQTERSIARNSKIGDDKYQDMMKERRGSTGIVPDLPWIDSEKRVVVAVCAIPGADVCIALDYRTSMIDPRVVACVYLGDGFEDDKGFHWVHVTDAFTEFGIQILQSIT